MLPVLYKFNTATSALKILELGQLWATDPLDFNDPFEILLAFDERRRQRARESRDEFGGRFPNANLYVTTLHADQYKIDFTEVTDLELLNCQKPFRPSSWRGRAR